MVRAILTDYDARGAAKIDPGAGHEREPVLRVTNLLRAFNASTRDGNFSIRLADALLGEEPMNSPTVFNFFLPDYQVPGAIAQAGLDSPEFQITTETTVTTIANYLNGIINGQSGITLNLSYDQTLAADPTQLVDHLNSLLMAGNMSSAMRNTLINAVTQVPATPAAGRARMAIYLVINSPEFVIDK